MGVVGGGDTELVSVYVDNQKSHVSTLERVLTSKKEGRLGSTLRWDLPGGPVLKTRHFHCRGQGSIPGQGTNILHAVWHGQR